jgi:ADP-dependent NAD(P)H-hydrate dehydratase / NAD(P)H-hydrate epimerase
MLSVLSRAQMRAFDAYAIEHARVPSVVLMENAGRGATDVLVRELLSGRPSLACGARVVVVCGAGNNGGDGFVVARHLLLRGAAPVVVLVADAERASKDARTNLDAWRGVGGEVRTAGPGAASAVLDDALAGAQVVVDAVFGTGLDRAIDGWLADVVRALNASRAPRFALDLPSGVDADTGEPLGVAVEAHVTATFAHHKLGLLTPQGARRAGRVHVVDIGVPTSLATHVGESARLLEASDLARWVSPRAPGAYKNAAGHVVVVAGSPGKIGAPQLVARGAMRAGAGLATIATWPDAATAIESRVLEAMTARIDPARPGESLDAIVAGKQAVALGPGLGLGEDARVVVEHLLASWQGPIVVDADALTILAASGAGQAGARTGGKTAILTPHPGELARLLGTTSAVVEGDRFRAARDAVAMTRAVVVLKGAHTIIASPDGRVAVSPVACPALATAGSGDVLGGIVAAMACSLPPFEAACAAVLVHALAGEAWSREHGGADRGMLASEIAEMLPAVVAGARG